MKSLENAFIWVQLDYLLTDFFHWSQNHKLQIQLIKQDYKNTNILFNLSFFSSLNKFKRNLYRPSNWSWIVFLGMANTDNSVLISCQIPLIPRIPWPSFRVINEVINDSESERGMATTGEYTTAFYANNLPQLQRTTIQILPCFSLTWKVSPIR